MDSITIKNKYKKVAITKASTSNFTIVINLLYT